MKKGSGRRQPSRVKKTMDFRRLMIKKAQSTRSRRALSDAMLFSLEGLNPVGGELKCLDTPWYTINSSTGNFLCVNAVPGGTGINQRIGLEIQVKNVEISFSISRIPDMVTAYEAGAIATNWRVVVWQDMFSNGSNVGLDNLFDRDKDPDHGISHGEGDLAYESCVLAPYNLYFRQRNVVMFDKLYKREATAYPREPQPAPITDRISLKVSIPTLYNPDNQQQGTYHNVSAGSIWFGITGDAGVWNATRAWASTFDIRACARIRYMDS